MNFLDYLTDVFRVIIFLIIATIMMLFAHFIMFILIITIALLIIKHREHLCLLKKKVERIFND